MELRAKYAFQLKQIKEAGIKDDMNVVLILKDNNGDAQKAMEIIQKLKDEKKKQKK